MADQDQESRSTADDALELNKETLQDLDLEPGDTENVKGGAGSIGSSYIKLPAVQMTLTGAITSAAGPANFALETRSTRS